MGTTRAVPLEGLNHMRMMPENRIDSSFSQRVGRVELRTSRVVLVLHTPMQLCDDEVRSGASRVCHLPTDR